MKASKRVVSLVVPVLFCALGLTAEKLHAAGSYEDTILADNPHAYWRLGEAGGATAYNAVGFPGGENGTYEGNATPGVAGIPGGGGNTAVGLDGSGDRVRALDAHSPTDYSLEAWVKLDSLPSSWANFVMRSDNDGFTSNTFSHILQVSSTGVLRHYTWDGASRWVDSTTLAQPGQWYHVVGEYKPGPAGVGFMSISVNGAQEGFWNAGTLNNPWNGGNRWMLGDSHQTLPDFAGTVDEVAIYHQTLTPTAVGAHYIAGMGLPAPTVGTFTGGDPGEGLDLKGNFLYAVNVGTAGLPLNNSGTYNVGDVVFAHDGANSGVTNTQSSVINNWANPNFGATSDDNNLEFVMQSIRHGGPAPAQIALTGLVPGREYKLQMAFTESCCDRGFDISVNGIQIADDFSPHGTQGGITNAPTNGAVVTYTFIASNPVANISFNGQTAPFPDKNPTLSALTLEDLSPNFRGNVALGKPIVDGSGAYNGRPFNDNTQGFAAAHVTDGSDVDVFGQSYWLASDGQTQQYFVLDLGEMDPDFYVNQIDLLNTHNTTQHNDRGTGDFLIRGSNDLALITGASSTEPIILAGTLSNVDGMTVIPADTFTAANGLAEGKYRYLRFETLTSNDPRGNVGLNEIRVYGNVPEPATMALLGLAACGLGGYLRRRRKA